MRTLPSAILAHLFDDPYLPCHLVELQGTTPHYFTDWTRDLVWNGHTWNHEPGFAASQIRADANGQREMTIAFDEERQLLQAIDLAEGMRDRGVVVREAWILATDVSVVLDVQPILTGQTGPLDFDEDGRSIGTLTVRAKQARGSFPRNRYEATCSNIFKDARCKYAGGTTSCARTFAACEALANTINFRGHRFALGSETRVTWGAVTVNL